MTKLPSPWDDAVLAATLFAIDPAASGGVALRARAGGVRETWLGALRALLPAEMPVKKIPLSAADDRLLGGLDLAGTLAAGRPVVERGILAEADGGIVLLAMAERVPAFTASRLAAVLDTGEIILERDGIGLRSAARVGVVALDEGIDEDERLAPGLTDRLSYHLDLSPIGEREPLPPLPDPSVITAARARLSAVTADEAIVEAICGTALALGVFSLRPALQALGAARAVAALRGGDTVLSADASVAARLVLSPRATMMPQAPPDAKNEDENEAEQEPEAPPDQEPPPPSPEQEGGEEAEGADPASERVLEAAKAAIPPGLLARLKAAEGAALRSRGAGKSGAAERSVKSGRPIGVIRGMPKRGARLNILETLRAAAPWQRLRSRPDAQKSGIAIRSDDFRITRLKKRNETATIFAVDASGSLAVNRLAEAKGAVELLLAECYVRRDRVALVAFRGALAELLLPPTRSLVRAKRCLASLPGGGGTPLALGLDAATELALSVQKQGMTPVVVLMTDGRANIGRDGKPGRDRAEAESLAAARVLRATGITSLLIDTSPRGHRLAEALAAEMAAIYLALPYADPTALSRTVQAAIRR
jgi:magnesium chelatase subunit D